LPEINFLYDKLLILRGIEFQILTLWYKNLCEFLRKN